MAGFQPATTGISRDPQGYNTCIRPVGRPHVARMLAGAIRAARKGDPTPDTGYRSGSLDRGRLARVASGDLRVFQQRFIPGPQRIRVIVLLDASGSMNGEIVSTARAARNGLTPNSTRRHTAAAQIGRDLADAITLLPNVEGAVYAHNLNYASDTTIHALWQKGENTEYVGDYANLGFDGNNDHMAIAYCTDDLVEARKPGEALVLIVASDGKPPDERAVKAQVDAARQRGVSVVSVALAPEAMDGQHQMYGSDVVPFNSEPMALAKGIAKAIGRVI
jgi:hypothetical protein